MFGSVWHGLERLAKIHNRYWLALGPLMVWCCAFGLSLIAHSNRFSLLMAIVLLVVGTGLALLAQGQWKIRAFEPDVSRFREAVMVGFSFLLGAVAGAPFVQGSDFLIYLVGLCALGSFGLLILLAHTLLKHPNLQ